jgi:hypothetical protein
MVIRQSIPDLYLESMLPAIDEIVQDRYKRWPPQFPNYFRMRSTNRGIEQTTEMTGFGQMVVVPEAVPVPYSQPYPAFRKTYLTVQYGLGFKVSRLARDDDRHGVVNKFASELGESGLETREVTAAAVFNGGFTDTGPDGVSLFNVAHPLVGAGGGTQTNRLSYASDPDMTSIGLALTDMRQTVDHTGKKKRIPPKQAIFPSGLEFVGATMLGGTDAPDTANRAINPFRKRSGLPSFDSWSVWDYLTDMNAWFIESDVALTELRFYEQEALNTIHDVDFDTRTLKTAAWQRFAVSYNAFWGVYGVPSS